jgi:AraC-like DNA-binding protein
MHSRLQKVFDLLQGKFEKTEHSYELTPEKVHLISDQLDKFMTDQKPFLRFGYGIRDLSTELKIPSYQLSAFLNRKIGLNFNDFLNHYRVRHCEELIQQGLVNQLNLKGLALRCGFNNRNTLTTAFKKFTGFTPSRYQKGWAKLLDSEMADV